MSTAEVAPDTPVEPEVPLEEPDTETPESQPAGPDPSVDPAAPVTQPDETPAEPTPEGEPAEPTVEPPAETPGEPTPEQQMKAQDKAFRRAKNYAKGVLEDLGDMAHTVTACPRCQDFLPGLILPHEIKPVEEQQRVAVKLSMGEAFEPVYKQSNQAATCSNCDGWGKVSTGSHVRGQDRVPCPDCKGKGFTGPLAMQSTTLDPTPIVTDDSTNGAEPEVKPDADPWGRLKSDPNYGILPGYEIN